MTVLHFLVVTCDSTVTVVITGGACLVLAGIALCD